LGQSKRNTPRDTAGENGSISGDDREEMPEETAGSPEEITLPLSEYMELQARVEELRDGMLRAAADYDNFRKRMEKERENIVCFANEQLIAELLPIMDNLERALESSHTQTEVESILDGVRMISGHLKGVLSQCGLETIESVGRPFDPNVHEAVGVIEAKDHDEGSVVGELQKGYKFKGKVVRPSKVQVSGGPSAENGEEE